MLPFWIALQFLTRIPINLPRLATTAEQRASLYWYPAVGLILGLLLTGLSLLAASIPTQLGAFVLLLVWILLTGGLHLDGLADSADAWLGGFGDRERSLQIMQDPRCGPAGVLSLICLCLSKWLGLQLLLQQHQQLGLILIPLLARALLPWLFFSTPYLRSGGLGQAFAQQLQLKPLMLGSGASLLLCLAYGGSGFKLAGVAVLCLYLLRRLMQQRLGGTTGDTAGALVEISEALLLIVWVI